MTLSPMILSLADDPLFLIVIPTRHRCSDPFTDSLNRRGIGAPMTLFKPTFLHVWMTFSLQTNKINISMSDEFLVLIWIRDRRSVTDVGMGQILKPLFSGNSLATQQ
ncbi:hypothetical protein CMV_000529 [Castanea mollissima]|uniref:Uncharacterized protein n=1 Tax=Castanea mollissima TaxID=60419 RepID=A0A8J4VYN6_9ROSI|nr:hypothetical protein CMV_000529 [Castanea mollissima]